MTRPPSILGLIAIALTLSACGGAAVVVNGGRESGSPEANRGLSIAVPPLPAPAGPTTSLANGLDPLPIVVRDLSDASSRDAVEAFASATVLQPWPLDHMADDAWAALTPAPGAEQSLDDLYKAVAVDPSPTDPDAFATLAQSAISGLLHDPRNADRLNNAAIALWLTGVRVDLDPNDQRSSSGYSEYVQIAATRLLEATAKAFPDNRATAINLSFLRSLVPMSGDSRLDLLDRLLERDSTDVTARLLKASIEARRADDPTGLEKARATLAPLLGQGGTPLGHAALGDALLAAASIRRARSPGLAQHQAIAAVTEYDEALKAIADPGLYAGRAAALALLGRTTDAVAAQQQALAMAPASIELRLGLARLAEEAADLRLVGETTDEAIGALRDWNPTISGLRYVTGAGGYFVNGDRGFLGWSFGSDRDHLPVTIRPQGGAFATIEIIPRSSLPSTDHALVSDVSPAAVFRLAAERAVAEGDPDAVAGLARDWARGLPFRSPIDELAQKAAILVRDGRQASDGAGDASDPSGVLAEAQESLRRLGRFDAAAELCRSIGAEAADASLRRRAADCAEESGYLAGKRGQADDEGPAVDAELSGRGRVVAGVVAEADGDTSRAEHLYRMAVAADDTDSGASGATRLLAAARLGDLVLSKGDPVAAIEDYDLALSTIEANGLAKANDYWQDASSVLEVGGVEVAVRNNRGIALLQSAQPKHDEAPDCAGSATHDLCTAALADFKAASAADPGNAIYQLNVGWAARLLGDTEGARAALAGAVGLDATLYPAFNDLGVLLAEHGDAAGARSAFTSAMSVAPDYDLAAWNLGILGLRDVPGGVLQGQADLERAIRLKPALRTAPLAFRLDERTYRAAFNTIVPAQPSASAGRSYSVGAVVLATASTLGAMTQFHAVIGAQMLGAASQGMLGWLERVPRTKRWRSWRRESRRRFGTRTRAIIPWIATGSVLAIVSAWQAVQGSPQTAVATILFTGLALVIAVVAHEIGHLIAARPFQGRLVPDHWGPGTALSLALLPVQVTAGPFLAERFRVVSGDHRYAWRIHLAGPVANALVAVAAYLVFVAEPLPVLRLIAQVQLAAIAYTLLPTRPLDGYFIARQKRVVLVVLGIATAVAASAFALEIL